MTSSPRTRPYHHGDLRQALLDAACEHLRRDNADSLSLRALARTIGVSQTAPYRHFDPRNALFAAIAIWGFEILDRELREKLGQQTGSAPDALIDLGMAYLSFAERHFEKYQMFFDSSLVEFEEYEELQKAGERCFEHMLSLIRRGRQEGLLRDQPEEEMAGILWGGLHGIASLLQTNRASQEFNEKPVGKAVAFLADDRRQVLTQLMNAITVERFDPS